jgi:hypothetical protein
MSFAPLPPPRSSITTITTPILKNVNEQLPCSTNRDDVKDSFNDSMNMYYNDKGIIFTVDSYDLVAGAGLINERMEDLLSLLDSGTGLREDDQIEERVKRISASLPEKENVNISNWANRLAKDVAHLMD